MWKEKTPKQERRVPVGALLPVAPPRRSESSLRHLSTFLQPAQPERPAEVSGTLFSLRLQELNTAAMTSDRTGESPFNNNNSWGKKCNSTVQLMKTLKTKQNKKGLLWSNMATDSLVVARRSAAAQAASESHMFHLDLRLSATANKYKWNAPRLAGFVGGHCLLLLFF